MNALVLIAAMCAGETPAGKVEFSRDILPILSDNCFACHGPDEKARKGKLRLDTKEGAFKPSKVEGRAIIAPGALLQSELIHRLTTGEAGEKMPPEKFGRQLTSSQVGLVKAWIDQGARWEEHWSFLPPARAPVPQINSAARTANPIDRFVVARLEQEKLVQSPRAEKTTLLRRLFLDLTGLPPSPATVRDFLADNSPGAYEKIVDRLLASPHYGERMVWDWLEAARYADSNGYQGDGERTMWPWRDWAATAFNDNLPFDQFTRWQLAGDLVANATQEQKLATGFNRNHMINGEGGRIPAENRVDYVMDMTETTGTVWLGLTFNCCRCHDHKYDPIRQRDYYQLFSFFNNTPVDGGGGNPQTPPIIETFSLAQAEEKKGLDRQVGLEQAGLEEGEKKFFPRDKGKTAAEAEAAKGFPKEQKEVLAKSAGSRGKAQIELLAKAVEKTNPAHFHLLEQLKKAIDRRDAFSRALPRVMIMEELTKPRETFILEKGNYEKPTVKVGTAVPAALPQLAAGAPANRLALADWLVSPGNPLPSRVVINRLWQQFFGLGIVKSTEDFGVQGEKPSHAELLDWLAVELRESGWDIKHMVRLIVCSETYQQASKVPPGMAERDPQNRLLGRGARFRLPSWMLRDQALAASGLLAVRLGGPPTRPYQPPGIWEEATFGNKKYVQDHGENLYKRSLYTFWRRIIGPTMFFDTAARQTCTVKQTRTNTPLHALATLNDITFVEAARALAERELLLASGKDDDAIAGIFLSILAREAKPDEALVLRSGLARAMKHYVANPGEAKKLLQVGETKANPGLDPVRHAAFTALALSVLNIDEALNKE
ncbi:MAG: DUF1549 domain-containing protein [Gemmataceae bacterium]|nr:DUF1549 domain-containing protein [Gemmataceae bacterium]